MEPPSSAPPPRNLPPETGGRVPLHVIAISVVLFAFAVIASALLWQDPETWGSLADLSEVRAAS